MELLNASVDQGLELFDKLTGKFVIRLAIDLLTTFIIIRIIYFRHYRRTELFLTFFAFNVTIFLIAYLLNKVEMTMGAAFGLFAVFSMLRYRTENISTKDMTYIFIVIAVGLVMAISKGGWDELGLIGLIVVVLMALLESNWLIRREYTQDIIYDRIELIQPDRRAELLSDLQVRTGLNIVRLEIGNIDLLKDTARITIFYH
ncbi:MAG: DUF4956 domain-containing protein [Bacteroidetes bacterium]|nr:DUF4956 domain-containing protein [Bacteroidota bacterium]